MSVEIYNWLDDENFMLGQIRGIKFNIRFGNGPLYFILDWIDPRINMIQDKEFIRIHLPKVMLILAVFIEPRR